MKLGAQTLVMDLLSAVGGRPISVRALVRAGEVFGITENNLRVALARLLASGKIERNERGLYGISAEALPVQSHVASWAELERRMVRWDGGFIGVHTGALEAGRRGAAKRRARALWFLGFRELVAGLWVRPDNLRDGAAGVRSALAELGFESSAPVFALKDLDDATEHRARGLWNAAAIGRGYEKTRAKLAESGAGLDELPLRQAMVECFLLGGRAIRELAFDPLLPEPIVKSELRRGLIDEMRRYDAAGRRVWRKFMNAEGAPQLESLIDFRQLGRVA
jgi:phenylacetic acid degradation operon negative regulatory protein